MADPVSMTLMVASTALQAGGQLRQGQYAAEQGRVNREAAYAEAEYRDQQAEQEIAVASVNNQRIANRMREILASNRVSAAAGGGSTSDASVIAVQKEAQSRSVLDMMREMASAEDAAKQIRYGADQVRRQGDMDYAAGKEARKASYLAAGATILQAGANWNQKFGNGKNSSSGESVSSGPKYNWAPGGAQSKSWGS